MNSIHIYDSNVITQVPILGHDLECYTQVDASVKSDYIVSATTCKK
jgi:hypothetical protein